MKIIEIRQLSVKELGIRKHELRDEIFRMRLQQQGGQLDKPSQFPVLRREIARVETVLMEKSRATAAEAK